MVEASTRLMVPLEVTTATRDVLAVALPPGLNRNGDGYADADNKNGVVDDDLPADETNDGGAGIIGIDDDGDGLVDNGASFTDNDENGTIGSAPVAPGPAPTGSTRWLPGRHPLGWSACPTSRPSTATTTPCAPSPTTRPPSASPASPPATGATGKSSSAPLTGPGGETGSWSRRLRVGAR